MENKSTVGVTAGMAGCEENRSTSAYTHNQQDTWNFSSDKNVEKEGKNINPLFYPVSNSQSPFIKMKNFSHAINTLQTM